MYFERIEQWQDVVDLCDDVEPELARRQYKALRTTVLCAKARALARLNKPSRANSVLAAAVRVCPRGAVDPLIVLEASKALVLSLRGDAAKADTHFDRALAACRAIGHRYHETWIEAARTDRRRATRETVAVTARTVDVDDAALLLTDAATILGAGHSIDLLAHRTLSILHGTAIGARVAVENESGCEYQPEPTASWEAEADGTFTLHLRGSDRRVVIRVRDVHSIEDVSLLKSLADIVRAGVHRTASADGDDEEQNLWPRTSVPAGEDTLFRSPRMIELARIAMRLADTDLPILITGETGTGKEIMARLIHDTSRVKRGPFVPFNSAAVSRELVESALFGHRRGAFTGAVDSAQGMIRAAERGTLFIDEVGDLELSVQPKLLRFLESREIHPVGEARPQQVMVRVVAATNAPLDRLVDEGRFRRDLFYRLNGTRLVMPPLRERKDEIPAFAALFLTKFARECGRANLRLADDFMAALLLHDWPGNIRELSNEIRRVVAMAHDGEVITSQALSPEILEHWNRRPTAPLASASPSVRIGLDQTLSSAIAELERRFIEHAMQTSGGQVAEAAALLGVSRKGLFLKRRRRGLGRRADVPA